MEQILGDSRADFTNLKAHITGLERNDFTLLKTVRPPLALSEARAIVTRLRRGRG